MADSTLLDNFGLSMTTLFSSQGSICVKNFSTIVASFSLPEHSLATKAAIADGLSLWGSTITPDTRKKSEKCLIEHFDSLFEIITQLATVANISTPVSSDEYRGEVYIAAKLAGTLQTTAMMDQTQALAAKYAPRAYAALDSILSANLPVQVVSAFQSVENANTYRAEVIKILIRTMPYQGTVDIPMGGNILAKVLLNEDMPMQVKQEAKSGFNTMANISKSSVMHAGPEIIALIKEGDNDSMMMLYVSMPELYAKAPSAVHQNLNLFMSQSYMMYCSLYYNIAQRDPKVLLPHVTYFMDNLTSSPAVGSVTLMIFSCIASSSPSAIYRHLPAIAKNAAAVSGGMTVLAGLYGKCALAAQPRDAADSVMQRLLLMLADKSADSTVQSVVLCTISNIKLFLSSKDVLIKAMPVITKYRSSNEIVFVALSDFAAGRSLEGLTNRVDELDARVGALNTRVSDTCNNMADVIAYVDANMADMKDFVAEVVKKLPSPKRLEVVGTLRKTLILHFECCHTGREYPVTSHEWSKWLKMGFSLVKAGQAVIDLGMGNPLGILKKGVECVQEIYSAYKTNDDDEFNTYITNPFLTSTEQDQLLEKLRAQNFFDLFAYDAQAPGWYLLDPSKGSVAGGDAGSVSKVRSKEGYGVTEGLVAAVQDAGQYFMPDLNLSVGGVALDQDCLSSALDAAAEAVLSASESEPGSASATAGAAAASGVGKSGKGVGGVGARAAALREQFGPSATAGADDRLQQANQTVDVQNQLADLQARVSTLEQELRSVSSNVQALQNKPACCTIQ